VAPVTGNSPGGITEDVADAVPLGETPVAVMAMPGVPPPSPTGVPPIPDRPSSPAAAVVVLVAPAIPTPPPAGVSPAPGVPLTWVMVVAERVAPGVPPPTPSAGVSPAPGIPLTSVTVVAERVTPGGSSPTPPTGRVPGVSPPPAPDGVCVAMNVPPPAPVGISSTLAGVVAPTPEVATGEDVTSTAGVRGVGVSGKRVAVAVPWATTVGEGVRSPGRGRAASATSKKRMSKTMRTRRFFFLISSSNRSCSNTANPAAPSRGLVQSRTRHSPVASS
jgi:hypothetical protein